MHAIAPLVLLGPSDRAWAELESVLAGMPRVEIATREAGYLHAVFTTALMRYRDDVEFWLRPDASAIDVRSASRVGYGDMGQNRRRIDEIRRALAARGVVAPSD